MMTEITKITTLKMLPSKGLFKAYVRSTGHSVLISKSVLNNNTHIYESTEMESSSLMSTNQNLDGWNLPTRFTLQNTCLPRRVRLLTPHLRNMSQKVNLKEVQNAVAKGEDLTWRALNYNNYSGLVSTGDKYFQMHKNNTMNTTNTNSKNTNKTKITFINPLTNQKVKVKFRIDPKVEAIDFSGMSYEDLVKLLRKNIKKVKKLKGILSVKENAISFFRSLIKVSENDPEMLEKTLALISNFQLKLNLVCLLDDMQRMWDDDEYILLEYEEIDDAA